MSLAQYRNKRKFTKTPEPRGKLEKSEGPLRFVIQRHQASQLHYDFRLELNGVLKSWAVPRGPSLNPEDKRLAVHVEDHPIEYAKFEGIIPKGNYGAGTVMIWDEGVYSPLTGVERDDAEKELIAQLKKGHLTFVLLGKKLKGEFALIKTGKVGEDSWLLVKKGDEFASEKNILDEDKSVISNRSMSEIKNGALKKNQIWYGKPKDIDFENASKVNFPHNINPMLAKSVKEPFDKEDWIFEVKWDGYRAIAEVDAGKVKLYSRNHLSFNDKFVPVVDSLKKFPGNAVLDGEVVVVDSAGKPVFQWLQDYPKSKKGELIYYVFDILHLDGHDLKKLPLLKRKEILKQILPPLPHLSFSDHIEKFGEEFFKHAVKLNLEGIMAKKVDSTYKVGFRTPDWLKIKSILRQEAIIAGYTSPKGGRKHFGALVLGIIKAGKLNYIGHTGGGFDESSLSSVLSKLKPLEQENCPFEVAPETNAPVTWVKPELICEVSFAQWTNDGIMRQPIFLGLRDDKDARDVEVEEVISEVNDLAIDEIEIGKQEVTISNPNKIFWPQEKYTKLDLINYYREVAPLILPHLADRPQSLLRFPNGINGEGFFQKHIESLNAKWIKRVKVRSDSKSIEYMLIQNEASLVYAINLGCIDLNPWYSRIGHLDYPDFMVIDLDPEAIDFKKVVEVALTFRKLFEKLEVESFVKTSGSRGIHIYVPMGAKYDYHQVRNFCQLLCLQIHNQLPGITSLVRNPKDRQRRVYLDYLQNGKGKTLASVYSVRPKPGATVSTPLKWEEVNSKLRISQFTIKNVLKRFEKNGDLFNGVIGKGIDVKKVLSKFDSN